MVLITLKHITVDIFDAVIDLEVDASQKNFVASNIYSLAEAYVTLVNQVTIPMPFAIYAKDVLVGFLMLSYDTNASDETKMATYSVWRMMIDKRYQQRGYGTAAMTSALEYIKTFPKGPAGAVILSYEPDNSVAKLLYETLGFVETGEIEDGEVGAKLTL